MAGGSAVDGYLRAGDVGRVVAEEEGDDRRHLAGLARASERGVADGGLAERLGRAAGHVGVDEAGVDDVDPDAARAELEAGRPRQPAHRPLRRRVGDRVVPVHPGERSDDDDGGSRRHQRRQRLDAEQRPADVDGVHAREIRGPDVAYPCPPRDPGARHQPVHGRALEPAREGRPRLLVGDVEVVGLRTG
jgi:hypothetical protein